MSSRIGMRRGTVGLTLAALFTLGPYLYMARTGLDVSAMMGEGSTDVAGVTVALELHASSFRLWRLAEMAVAEVLPMAFLHCQFA